MPDQPTNPVQRASEEEVTNSSLTENQDCEDTTSGSPGAKHEASDASEATAQDAVVDPGPRGKKRKLSTPKTPEKSHVKKFPSPPWKKFEPSNPTSFNQDGRRKSGRTNTLPIEHQPSNTTRGKNAAYVQEHSASRKQEDPPGSKKRKAEDEGSARPSLKANKTSHNRSSSDAKGLKSSPRLPPARAQKPTVKQPAQSEVNGQPFRRSRHSSSSLQHRASEHDIGLDGAQEDQPDAPPRQYKPIRLKLRRPPPEHPPISSPLNVPLPKKFTSLSECLDQQDLPPEEGGERPLTHEQAQKEAEIWRRLEIAARPGGVLHGDAWLGVDNRDHPDQGPAQEASHVDYLMTHVKMFVKELNAERIQHKKLAKVLADEARATWLKKQPKSIDEVLKDYSNMVRQRKERCMRDLSHRWSWFTEHVKQLKLREHEAEQQKKIEQDLAHLVGQSQSTSKLMRQKKDSSGGKKSLPTGHDEATEELAFESSDDSEVDSDDDESASDDSMTSSESELSAEGAGEDTADLGGEALYRHIYGDDWKEYINPDVKRVEEAEKNGESAPEDDRSSTQSGPAEHSQAGSPPHLQPQVTTAPTEPDESSHEDDVDHTSGKPDLETQDTAMPDTDYSAVQLDDVDDALMDDEDGSESDSGTEVTEDDGVSVEEEVSDSEEEDSKGLMGFFAPSIRRNMQKTPEESLNSPSSDGAARTNMITDQVASANLLQASTPTVNDTLLAKSDGTSTTDVPSGQDTPATTVDFPASGHGSEHGSEETQVASNTAMETAFRTPVPSLLRGNLRVYQHQGLDWLAGMYDSDTNGILADEMGLGKTIQTIALLSHLATSKGIWGPHLVVVPTSVILNWEMEFKKFCPGFKILTYYGNQEERREKRKGWLDNDRWHVCITSYQLALADQVALKRRNWHYIVLDEAHNIKNFQSQRWQTLLTFKSHARLLLTGTPLQNNLTELWSLLFFLAPETDEHGETRFKDLKSFSSLFKRPVEQILDNGREALDDQAKEIVAKLHHVLRPHLLRRLKADVEKQMPKKFEHVVRCRLSKRQRQLYDGFMSQATTRESFASGNYMSIINCLMQLRKVCNHPDLFETRQIVTSYAMPKSAIAEYEIKEMLVRRTLLRDQDERQSNSMMLHLWHANTPSLHVARARQLGALTPLKTAFHASREHAKTFNHAGYSSLDLGLEIFDKKLQERRTNELSIAYRETAGNLRTAPMFPIGLMGRFNFERPTYEAGSKPKRCIRRAEWYLDTPTVLQEAFSLNPAQSWLTELAVRKFGCVTPAVVAAGMAQHALTRTGVQAIESIEPLYSENPFHEAQTRLSIAFPDRALIQYDCGKLQKLHQLLIELKKQKSRCLIFTQMTKVLDILEQFMNLHGHRYLRLDGTTKIESRQGLTDQFNNDESFLAFILSSRSGGLGINLTGADTVIFYDLDWNPAMDKQCQDRCHRIGQTKDVHIYRFVSDGTIEANILRKSNQKRMLDDVVIQEGGFDTEAFYRPDDEAEEVDADTAAALDKVLGGATEHNQGQRILDQVEDKEDVEAAREAQKEIMNTDEVDFQEKSTPVAQAPDAKYEAPRPADALQTVGGAVEQIQQATPENEVEEPGSFEDYMLRFKQWELKDAVFVTMSDKQRKRAKKGKDHGIRIRV